MTPPRRFYRRSRFWLIIAALIVLPILAFLVLNQISPAPQALLVRQLITLAEYGLPPNWADVEANVVIEPNLVYDERTPNRPTLDIYHPTSLPDVPRPVLVYIHGGGFIGGSKDAVRSYAMTLAHAGYVVANVNYALAPEQPYPAAITQINTALAYVTAHAGVYSGNPRQVFIGGNSAGAHLTSQMAALITDPAYAATVGITPAISPEQLHGVVLINGVYDMQTLRATSFPGIAQYMWAYTGQRDFEAYPRINEISTIQHVTPAYPPTFITAGDADPLAGQTTAMIAALDAQGIDVTPLLFTGTNANLDHDFALNLDTPHGQQALAEILDFLADHSQS